MEPFTDVDVLDLTQSIAGPVATQQLGALGANVVKVEPPGGDDFRGNLSGSMFTSFNLGEKRSLCLDLRTDDGREALDVLFSVDRVSAFPDRLELLEEFLPVGDRVLRVTAEPRLLEYRFDLGSWERIDLPAAVAWSIGRRRPRSASVFYT